MATFTGNQGDLTVGGSVLGEVTQWEINEAIGTASNSSKGDAWDTHASGRKSWTASVTAFFDQAATAQSSCVIGASLSFVFRPDGTGATATFTGTGTITGRQVVSPEDPAGTCTLAITVLGNGALTEA